MQTASDRLEHKLTKNIYKKQHYHQTSK